MTNLVDLEAQGIDPYDFDAHFEREVVIYLLRSERFFNLYGQVVQPELFRAAPAQLLVEFAKKVHQETERPPGGIGVVLQRLAEERKRGKKQDEIGAACDYIEEGLDSPKGLSAEDSVIDRVRAVLEKDLKRQFVEKAILELKPGGDMGALAEELQAIQSLGRQQIKFGTVIGDGDASWRDIDEVANAERITTGIVPLNAELDGGANRGGLYVWLADSGFGKSMACAQATGANLKEGLFVYYISAELSKGEVEARVKANITGLKINEIKKDKNIRADVDRLLRYSNPKGGRVVVDQVTAYATTVQDCIDMAKREQDRAKRKINLFIVDPLDRLAAPKVTGDYNAARVIYDTFRGFIDTEKIFGMTACQGTRKKTGKEKRKRLDLEDMADSIHKARIADIVVSINEDEETGGLFFFVAKHRTGNARMEVGRFRTDFAHARLIRETGANDAAFDPDEGF